LQKPYQIEALWVEDTGLGFSPWGQWQPLREIFALLTHNCFRTSLRFSFPAYKRRAHFLSSQGLHKHLEMTSSGPDK
jgi:hypothetical protein